MKKLVILSFSILEKDSRVLRTLRSALKYYDVNVISMTQNASFLINSFPKAAFYFLRASNNSGNKSIYDYIYWQFILRFQCAAVLNNYKADIIWANDFETLFSTFLSSSTAHSKVVYDSHEIWAERAGCKKSVIHRMINYFEKKIENFLVRKTDTIITVSDEVADYLSKSWNVDRGRLTVVRNIPEISPVSLNSLDFSIPQSILERKHKFVYAGEISNRRNSHFLIEAFKSINRNDVSLVLAGNSSLGIQEGFLTDKIYYAGQIKERELHLFLSLFDIGIHTLPMNGSINHECALPNKLFQYAHSGLALCFFRNTPVANIIEINGNGICGPTENVSNISTLINRMCSADIDSMKESSKIFAKKSLWENEKMILEKEMRRFF